MQQQIQLIFFTLLFCTSNLRAQQEYSGESVFNCDKTAPSPSQCYTCNGQNQSCRTFLIFRAQPSYNLVSTISHLLSSNPSELARFNSVSDSSLFPANKEVIVPVNCSCSGQYYQANTSYILGDNNTYYSIAKDVYQGLSTCNALISENPYDPDNLQIGQQLLVPLRCACPTCKQVADGIRYLLTYSIHDGDSVPDLSKRFNVNNLATVFTNGFSEQDPIVFSFTTILIPLAREPLSSQTIIHYDPLQIPPPPPLSGSPVANREKRGIHVGIFIGGAALIVLFAVIATAFWYLRRRVKRVGEKKKDILPKDMIEAIVGVDRVLKEYNFEELKTATNNFSPESRIEGSVYWGVVRGNVFAIKETNADVSTEVNILHKLNHFNLITLCGISAGLENFYLIYEYMENGSLKDCLHDHTNRSGLWSWNQIVQITLDVANGLDYLHNFAEVPYVHKNINSSNILLNGNFRAKIANFSFAKSSKRREEYGFSVTATVTGTLGYMAPEYLEFGLVTPKLDVYAFGVVIAELITGKDAVIKHEGREKLLSSAIISIVEGRDAEVELSHFMDVDMRGRCPMSLALAMAKLGAACVREDPENRPNMDELVSVLLKIQRDSQYWETANL